MAVLNHILSIMLTPLFVLGGTSVTIASIVELIALSFLLIKLAPKINVWVLKKLPTHLASKDMLKVFVRISRWVILLIGFVAILHLIGIDAWLFAKLHKVYAFSTGIIDLKLFKLGNTQLTLWTVTYLVIVAWLLVRITGQIPNFVVNKFLAPTKLDIGIKRALGTALHYGLLMIGLIVLLQTAGIDLSALTVLIGALGIGISFGLQTITNNFISGLIIFFERPIKIGDRIQIGDVVGEVVDISLRATTVITNQNIAIVVPNSLFITSNVVNWTYNDRSVGLKFPVSVSSKADPELAHKLLTDVVTSNAGVLSNPKPSILFQELSQDAMKFVIYVWTRNFLAFPDTLRSELNFAISKKLREAGIDAQFPEGESELIKIAAPEKAA